MTRIHAIDYLKVLIASFVVLAHSGLFVQDVGPEGYVVGFAILRASVPTFALISGFLLHSTWHHGRVRLWLAKLLVAYLAWVAFYLPVWWPSPATFGAVAVELIFGPLHLWYLSALMLAVGMLVGVLSLIPDRARARRVLLWTAVAALIAGTAAQVLIFFTPLELPLNAYRNGVFVEYPYAAFGFLLADRIQRKGDDALPSLRTAGLLLAGMTALRLGEVGIYMTIYGPSLNFPPEFPFLAAAFSVAILLFTLRLRLPEPPVNLAFVAVMVYFLHIFLMLVGMKFGVSGLWELAAVGFFGSVLVALVLLWMARRMEGRMPALLRKLLLRGVLRLSPSQGGMSGARDRTMRGPGDTA